MSRVTSSSATGSNPSIGLTGSTAPTSATEVGGINPSGNLQALKLDASGALIVDIGGSALTTTVLVLFNAVAAIAVGIETVLNTYTAPLTGTSYLLEVLDSGQNRAQYNVYVNSVLIDTAYVGLTKLFADFDYRTGVPTSPGYIIPPGIVLQATVINAGTSSANYNARFLILETI